jgi:hypothetical protein
MSWEAAVLQSEELSYVGNALTDILGR